MGYSTDYTVSTLDNFLVSQEPTCEHKFPEDYSYCPKCGKPRIKNFSVEELIFSVEELIVDFLAKKYPQYGNFNPFNDSCKWYEHNTDMMEISKKYPNVVFVLHGEGEEAGDLWNAYYKNGKMQKCKGKITYDDFDEKELK